MCIRNNRGNPGNPSFIWESMSIRTEMFINACGCVRDVLEDFVCSIFHI